MQKVYSLLQKLVQKLILQASTVSIINTIIDINVWKE